MKAKSSSKAPNPKAVKPRASSSSPKTPAPTPRLSKAAWAAKVAKARAAGEVVYLSGGNPQIAKGDGDAIVQQYIRAMPGWKRAVGERLDTLIEKTIPKGEKAVRWNSPFYSAGQGFILSFHVYAKYVRVTFLYGQKLSPLPPGPSRDPNARHLDLHEHDALDEQQFVAWVKQAAAVPGWIP